MKLNLLVLKMLRSFEWHHGMTEDMTTAFKMVHVLQEKPALGMEIHRKKQNHSVIPVRGQKMLMLI